MLGKFQPSIRQDSTQRKQTHRDLFVLRYRKSLLDVGSNPDRCFAMHHRSYGRIHGRRCFRRRNDLTQDRVGSLRQNWWVCLRFLVLARFEKRDQGDRYTRAYPYKLDLYR